MGDSVIRRKSDGVLVMAGVCVKQKSVWSCGMRDGWVIEKTVLVGEEVVLKLEVADGR
mgnify:CR=1 FL=1